MMKVIKLPDAMIREQQRTVRARIPGSDFTVIQIDFIVFSLDLLIDATCPRSGGFLFRWFLF